MSETVIKVENISKMYDLGLVGTGTLSKDLNRTWARLLGKPDPYATLAELNDRTQKSNSKSGSVWALKDINFEVKQGEVLGIIGKNGAGKSTLLKILSQITTPSSGEIKIKGRVASLLEVGTGMHPEMTARQNIYLNGSMMGMTRKEVTDKLDEIVDFAGIGKYIDTPIKRFSSGMTVRLGFAVAAFLEPEILIVDEVLAVGDAEFQKKAIGKMKDVSKGEGRTVLFVSHNMAAVKSLCTRGLLIEKGTISYTGNIVDCITEYLKTEEVKHYDKNKLFKANKNGVIKKIFIKEEYLSTGSSLTFCFDFFQQKFDFSIEIGIYSIKNSEKIYHISTDYSNSKKITSLTNKIECSIKKLNLTEGVYYINYAILNKFSVIERFENALYFEVFNGDYYKIGENLSAKILAQNTVIEYEWKL